MPPVVLNHLNIAHQQQAVSVSIHMQLQWHCTCEVPSSVISWCACLRAPSGITPRPTPQSTVDILATLLPHGRYRLSTPRVFGQTPGKPLGASSGPMPGTHQEVYRAGEDAGEHELEGQRHEALGNEERRVVVEAVADLPPQQRLLRVPAARPAPSEHGIDIPASLLEKPEVHLVLCRLWPGVGYGARRTQCTDASACHVCEALSSVCKALATQSG